METIVFKFNTTMASKLAIYLYEKFPEQAKTVKFKRVECIWNVTVPEELYAEVSRFTLKEGNDAATKIAKSRGYSLHPKLKPAAEKNA